jgi:hypothetical protein
VFAEMQHTDYMSAGWGRSSPITCRCRFNSDRVQPHRRIGDQAVGRADDMTKAAVSPVIGILVIARAINMFK